MFSNTNFNRNPGIALKHSSAAAQTQLFSFMESDHQCLHSNSGEYRERRKLAPCGWPSIRSPAFFHSVSQSFNSRLALSVAGQPMETKAEAKFTYSIFSLLFPSLGALQRAFGKMVTTLHERVEFLKL